MFGAALFGVLVDDVVQIVAGRYQRDQVEQEAVGSSAAGDVMEFRRHDRALCSTRFGGAEFAYIPARAARGMFAWLRNAAGFDAAPGCCVRVAV